MVRNCTNDTAGAMRLCLCEQNAIPPAVIGVCINEYDFAGNVQFLISICCSLSSINKQTADILRREIR